MNINEIPTNLEDTYNIIDKLEIEGKKYWLSNNQEDSISMSHMGLGMWIRNNFKLWEDDSELKKWFIDNYFIDHPDDISSIILLYYHQKKNGNKIELNKMLNNFYSHWYEYEPYYKNKLRRFKLNKLNKLNNLENERLKN